MESVILNSEYTSKLQGNLQEEGSLDIAQYHQAGFFDEVPLYSRFSTVSSPKSLDRDDADTILPEFALQFLEKVAQYRTLERPLSVAITIM